MPDGDDDGDDDESLRSFGRGCGGLEFFSGGERGTMRDGDDDGDDDDDESLRSFGGGCGAAPLTD